MCDLNTKLEQVKKLKGGKGIQYLLDEAYKILGNPIAMFNTEYSLMGYTNFVITDDPVWNELIIYGNFSHETQVLFMQEGFIDAVADTESLAFLVSDKLKYDRVLGKLYSYTSVSKVHVANLILVACGRPFEDDDAAVFEAVCDVFSNVITKSTFYQTYGKMYQENYIRKLIDSKIEEKELYSAQIAIVYNGFKSSMRMLVADIGKCDPEYSKLVYFRDLFRQIQGHFEYAVYSKYLLIIIDSYDKEFNAKRDLNKIYKIFMDNKICAGVSDSFDNMFELRKHYYEAENALSEGLKKDSGKQFFVHEVID